MRAVTFYHKETGELGRQVIVSNDETLALNTPADHLPIDGHHNPRTKCVDVKTGNIVARVAQPVDKSPQVIARIEALEAKQHRAIREALLLGTPESLERLKTLDAQIATLRSELA